MIVSGTCRMSFDFEVELEGVKSISSKAMPIHESDALIEKAIEKKYGVKVLTIDDITVTRIKQGADVREEENDKEEDC